MKTRVRINMRQQRHKLLRMFMKKRVPVRIGRRLAGDPPGYIRTAAERLHNRRLEKMYKHWPRYERYTDAKLQYRWARNADGSRVYSR